MTRPLPRPPGHTCPAIDRCLRLVRAHVLCDETRAELVALLEQLRADNLQLREAQGAAERALARMRS